MNDESEREDGEIVDDEDNIFEELSDCSISSAFNSGKLPAYQDNISIVSLSSISDNEETINTRRKRCSRHLCDRRKRKLSYSRSQHGSNSKYYRQYKEDSDSTSEDEILNRKVLRQLKEAVRIETHGKNNNLESRLKQMLKNNNKEDDSGINDEDAELEKLRSDALNTKNNKDFETNKGLTRNDSIDDNELVELRLAALKSAVIQKHIQRKKRKEEEKQESHVPEIIIIDDTNKENTNLESTTNVVECATVETIITDCAEQNNEEVLHNIEDSVKPKSEHLNTTVEEDVDIMRAKLLASMSKKITSVITLPNKQTPAVIPSMTLNTHINYKSGIVIKPNTVNHVKPNNILKIPMVNVKPLVISINGESESDSEIELIEEKKPSTNDDAIALKVTEFLKKTRAEAEANKPDTNDNVNMSVSLDTSDSILAEKSVVKLLPKSQQQEYRMLKQKLLNAKRKRVRKPSLRQANMCNNNKTVPNINNNHQQKKPSEGDIQILKNERNVPAQVADRLQMKGKYKELGPLLQKVNQASIQKKKIEQQIKRLLEELKQSRKSLIDWQTVYSKLLKELILKKEAIDTRFRPNKFKHTTIISQELILPSSTPVKDVKDIKEIKETIETTEKPETIIDEVQTEKIETKDEEEIIVEKKIANFPEYISPLGPNTRNVIADPLGTFCPYEIFGVCKDPECTYKHYS